MAKVVFSPLAQADMDETAGYMENILHNPAAARRFVENMKRQTLALREFPKMGTRIYNEDSKTDYRRLVCGNYIAVYHIMADAVYIDRVLYGRRNYLALLFGDQQDQDEEEDP